MCSSSWHYILFFVLLYSHAIIRVNSVSSMLPSCADHERSALLQFKHSFHIDCSHSSSPTAYPKVKSWMAGAKGDCCLWDGVECDEETGHVVGLDVSSSCLHGTFPSNSTLFSLTHLKQLSLADNHFNLSRIPSKLGQFYMLRSLNLSNSAFIGQIPLEISRLFKLSVLDLSVHGGPGGDGDPFVDTKFNLKLQDPSLERLVQNLTSLERLYLDLVDISSPLSNVLMNLTSLTAISFISCNLYGKLPTSLLHLPHLEILKLNGNENLRGVLPEFQHNSPLKELRLSFTSFSGEVPPSIGKLAHLEVLQLDACHLWGSIPSSLSNLTKLTELVLGYNDFGGDISSIANLTQLQILDLSGFFGVRLENMNSCMLNLNKLTYLALESMNLTGEIPSFLTNMTKLKWLVLANNQLMGSFPLWFANLTQLEHLYIEHNLLEGEIPQWLSKFSSLESLSLSSNSFVEFDIFFNLKKLRYLLLYRLSLTFPPLSSINSSLLNLKLLALSHCNLTEFPHFLRHQNELQYLFLDGNNIEGSIPEWFVNITKDNLLELDISGNNLTGFQQPVTVLPWICMEALHFKGNKLQGLLPTPPNSLKVYDVSDNLLTGVIPKQICNAESLVILDLSNNSLSGQIPDCIGHKLTDSLQILNLRGNNLHGTIPSTFTRSCKLKMVNLNQNQLDGSLPRSMANCIMLEVLDIGKNHFNDTFPSWLGSLPELQVLVLGCNNFHGSIKNPESALGFPLLRIIDLSNNFYMGNLPSGYLQNWHAMRVSKENHPESSYTIFSFGRLTYLTLSKLRFQYSITITNKGTERLYPKILNDLRVIDFSSNNFTGTIPDVLGELKGLQALNLSNNNLNGEIPPSLANMTDLESLDLSLNMLSGAITPKLQQLTSLEVFNISHNHLQGPIPQDNQFTTFDNSSFEGNSGLCGRPLSKKCENDEVIPSLPPPMTSDEKNEDSQLINWIIRSLGFVSGTIVGFVIGKCYITDKYHEWFMETFGRRTMKRRVRRAPTLRR